MSMFLRLSVPAFALSLFGCASQERAEPTMQLAAGHIERDEGTLVKAERAVDRLATGRCLGVERCEERGYGNLSDDGRNLADYPPQGYEECRNFYRQEAEDLVQSCGASGIDAKSVAECANQWSTIQDCSGNKEGPLSLLAACSPERICR